MEGEKKSSSRQKTTESISVLRRAASDKQSSKERAHDETLPGDCLKTSIYRPAICHTGSHSEPVAQPRSSAGVFER